MVLVAIPYMEVAMTSDMVQMYIVSDVPNVNIFQPLFYLSSFHFCENITLHSLEREKKENIHFYPNPSFSLRSFISAKI